MANDKKLVTIGYIIIALLAVNTMLLGGLYCKLGCGKGWSKGYGKICPFTGKNLDGSQKGSASGSMKGSAQ